MKNIHDTILANFVILKFYKSTIEHIKNYSHNLFYYQIIDN